MGFRKLKNWQKAHKSVDLIKLVRYTKTPNVDLRDMGYKEGLNRGIGVNEGAKHKKASKPVC